MVHLTKRFILYTTHTLQNGISVLFSRVLLLTSSVALALETGAIGRQIPGLGLKVQNDHESCRYCLLVR